MADIAIINATEITAALTLLLRGIAFSGQNITGTPIG
jgi:hypothetical protein